MRCIRLVCVEFLVNKLTLGHFFSKYEAVSIHLNVIHFYSSSPKLYKISN